MVFVVPEAYKWGWGLGFFFGFGFFLFFSIKLGWFVFPPPRRNFSRTYTLCTEACKTQRHNCGWGSPLLLPAPASPSLQQGKAGGTRCQPQGFVLPALGGTRCQPQGLPLTFRTG